MLDSERLLIYLFPSRHMLAWLLSIHGLALLSVLVLYGNDRIHPASVLLVLAALSLAYYLKRANAVERLSIASTGECTLVTINGGECDVVLSDRCYCSDWLVILSFREADFKKHRYLVLMPDSVNALMLKQLKSMMKTSLFNSGM